MKFSGEVGNGPVNKCLNFGSDPDHRLDTGIVFRIRHYWDTRKVVNGHSFILVRQMAALVRRALAEVCTVPVLLVTDDLQMLRVTDVLQKNSCPVFNARRLHNAYA